jgi:hypothetical protein
MCLFDDFGQSRIQEHVILINLTPVSFDCLLIANDCLSRSISLAKFEIRFVKHFQEFPFFIESIENDCLPRISLNSLRIFEVLWANCSPTSLFVQKVALADDRGNEVNKGANKGANSSSPPFSSLRD